MPVQSHQVLRDTPRVRLRRLSPVCFTEREREAHRALTPAVPEEGQKVVLMLRVPPSCPGLTSYP